MPREPKRNNSTANYLIKCKALKTYRNWFAAQKIKIVIFAKQVDVLLISLKSLATHDKVTAKILA